MGCTTIIEKHATTREGTCKEGPGADKSLINPGECYRWEGGLSPNALLSFVFKGRTTELLRQLNAKPLSYSVTTKPLSYLATAD